jgi:hypothetical protein
MSDRSARVPRLEVRWLGPCSPSLCPSLCPSLGRDKTCRRVTREVAKPLYCKGLALPGTVGRTPGLVDTEGVSSSNLLSPTGEIAGQRGFRPPLTRVTTSAIAGRRRARVLCRRLCRRSDRSPASPRRDGAPTPQQVSSGGATSARSAIRAPRERQGPRRSVPPRAPCPRPCRSR